MKTHQCQRSYNDSFLKAQKSIHETVRTIGGYMPPLQTLAHLVEKNACLGSILFAEERDGVREQEKLEEILLLMLCLANQYCVLLEDVKIGDSLADKEVIFRNLTIIIGEITAIINYDEDLSGKQGSKERAGLAHLFTLYQTQLYALAITFEIPLRLLMGDRANEFTKENKVLFENRHDPTTVLSLERFSEIRVKTSCIFATNVKLWGSVWHSFQSLEANVERNIPSILRFIRCGEVERLDGFVMEVPEPLYGVDISNLCKTVKRILTYLSDHDPTGNRCMNQNLDSINWQYSFNNQRFFISTFAPCYPESSPRYSHNKDSVFIFFQPEYSFSQQIASAKFSPKRGTIHEVIRKKFAENKSSYDVSIASQPIEAFKYVKPLALGDKPIKWWEY